MRRLLRAVSSGATLFAQVLVLVCRIERVNVTVYLHALKEMLDSLAFFQIEYSV